jgi:hypothetical protein
MKKRMLRIDFPALLVIGYLLLAIGLTITAAASSGCDAAATAKHAGKAVIDCTVLNGDKLAAVVAEIKKLIGREPSAALAKAIEAGKAIGGCALAKVVLERSMSPAAGAALHDPAAPARAVLEEFRRDHAAGATFRLSTGDV